MNNWVAYKKRVYFFLGSQCIPEEEIHGTSNGLKWLIVYFWSTYVLYDKDMLHKVSQTFLWKTRDSRRQLLRRKPVLKIIEHFKKIVGGGGPILVIFLVCCYKIDVLLWIIFHNSQTNNYMASPVSIPLNIFRIWEGSQVACYDCTNLILVVTYTICKDVLGTQSNIYDRAFLPR